MADNVNTRLSKAQIRHMHWLERFKGGLVSDINKLLFAFDVELRLELLSKADKVNWTKKQQDAFIAKLIKMQNQSADVYINQLLEDMREFGAQEAKFQSGLIGDALPNEILAFVNLQTPSEAQVWSYAINRPMTMDNGTSAILKPYIKSISENKNRIIGQNIREGFVLGKSTSEISRSLLGTLGAKFQDGNIRKAYTWAEAVTRTSLNHMASSARHATYDANRDIIKGYQWVSTLDSRTSFLCQGYDGKVWIYDNPSESTLDSERQSPAHPNCRSTTVPITKSWRELGIDIDEIDGGTRSSMDGLVSDKITYSEWLKGEPTAVQKEVLGASRFKAWKAGDVMIDQFAKDGRVLTLEELGVMDVRFKGEQ